MHRSVDLLNFNPQQKQSPKTSKCTDIMATLNRVEDQQSENQSRFLKNVTLVDVNSNTAVPINVSQYSLLNQFQHQKKHYSHHQNHKTKGNKRFQHEDINQKYKHSNFSDTFVNSQEHLYSNDFYNMPKTVHENCVTPEQEQQNLIQQRHQRISPNISALSNNTPHTDINYMTQQQHHRPYLTGHKASKTPKTTTNFWLYNTSKYQQPLRQEIDNLQHQSILQQQLNYQELEYPQFHAYPHQNHPNYLQTLQNHSHNVNQIYHLNYSQQHQQLTNWLASINQLKNADKFVENNIISLDAVLKLNSGDLDAMLIYDPEDRKKILNSILLYKTAAKYQLTRKQPTLLA